MKSARILCVGVSTLDQIFKVPHFPVPGEKTRATDFTEVSGGNAGNAAIAAARLGGRVMITSPFAEDQVGAEIRKLLQKENIDCTHAVTIPNAVSPLSAIVVDSSGERTIVSRRSQNLGSARLVDADKVLGDVDAVLIDNRFPEFSLDVAQRAHKRGLPIVMDADEPTRMTEDLFAASTHVIFSAHGLRDTTGLKDPEESLRQVAKLTGAYVSVTSGSAGAIWLDNGEIRRDAAFKIEAVDTLGAGDVYHGAFALALGEGRDIAATRRFSAAAAALKCLRFGGIAGAPTRSELEAFLAAA